MAKNKKSNKRIEKKRTQQTQREKLVKSGIDPKTARRTKGVTLQKQSAKIDKKNQNIKNRQYLLAEGIDNRILTQKQLYRRTEKFLQDRQNLKKWRKETRELHRFDRLLEAGYKKEEIRKSWLRYDKITNFYIEEKIQYTICYSSYYICVMYADVLGDSEIDPDQFKRYSFRELKEEIKERYEEALNNPDDSGTFHGAFRIMRSRDKGLLRLTASAWEKRGYNVRIGKFNKSTYDTVTLKNDFTPREYAEMLLLIMNHSSNADAVEHYQTLMHYATGFDNDLIINIFY